MAQGQISKYQKQPTTVYCSDCKHFLRDTEGPSRRNGLGEFFMGQCLAGLHPDTIKKQFADKPRRCDSYSKQLTA